TRLSDLIRVGPRATAVAILGVVVPFGLGYAFMRLVMDEPNISSVFVATAMVATSVGITARVLQELNVIGSIEARIILGAAVIDDVLALLLLTIVTGTTGSDAVSAWGFALIVAQALGFIALVILVGRRVFVRYHPNLSRLHLPDAPLVVALGVMMGLAGLASFFQLAAIIGAFLAGMVFAEFPEREALNERMRPIYHFLVPFFFVLIGTQVNLGVFRDGEVVALAIGVTLLAIAGKLIGGGIAGWGMKVRSVLIISVGMVPRGEVGLIVAGIAISAGAIDTRLFSAVVFMSIATTLVVPPLLNILYARQPTPIEGQPSGP
ncbi:MAG: cation:proton antiporter, partial [Chloroflexi bacterium]|nr:cation:proton antiporter [Chloroflexota bacterium]